MRNSIFTTSVEKKEKKEIYLSGNKDFFIPIVFPDYKISVVGKKNIEFSKVEITTPQIKIPYLGHAGVLIIDGNNGKALYYEYGRYINERSNISGNVRKIEEMPNVSIGNGAIKESSFKEILKKISTESGQKGKISGSVLRGDFFNKAKSWLESQESMNNSLEKKPYDLDENNCLTFVTNLAKYLSLDASTGIPIPMFDDISVPIPDSEIPSAYIELYQVTKPDLDYDYDSNTLSITD